MSITTIQLRNGVINAIFAGTIINSPKYDSWVNHYFTLALNIRPVNVSVDLFNVFKSSLFQT